jgi:predicted NBD/HSP70 family sugar kinase
MCRTAVCVDAAAKGCIEAYAGFYAILRMAFEVPLDTIPAKFVPISELDKIAARARQGHRMSAFAFRQAGIALGNGLSRLLSLTERMPVAITGQGTRYYDLLRRGSKRGWRSRIWCGWKECRSCASCSTSSCWCSRGI